MRTSNLKKVGFWYSSFEPNLPRPQVVSWDSHVKEQVLKYLDAGQNVAQYRGMSSCRICGINNGSLDLF